ncbi:unnamed protein product, partial [Mesorhabditis belari]|uniref:ERCC4 domain-containing protein n=1 Tax=Mesorhabditis belari TaxID=2138241 RepID=A0AAF3EPK1_9BILA
MEIKLYVHLRDDTGDVGGFKTFTFGATSTVDDLMGQIRDVFHIPLQHQEVYLVRAGTETKNETLEQLKSGTLQEVKVTNKSNIYVKHADLPQYLQYKACVENAKKLKGEEQTSNAEDAIKLHMRLMEKEKVTKYNVKCHHYGATSARPKGMPLQIREFYIYKLLELIDVGPHSQFILPNKCAGSKTSMYIATKWNDDFVSIKEEENVSVEVLVQLLLLAAFLFINDLNQDNCGHWKGTKDAAIVDFDPSTNEVENLLVSREYDTIREEAPRLSVSTLNAGGFEEGTLPPPKIIVDMREFNSELPTILYKKGYDVVAATLEVGDYVLSPGMTVERKALDDLTQSLQSGRVFKQTEQMLRHYGSAFLLIESNMRFELKIVNGGPFQVY